MSNTNVNNNIMIFNTLYNQEYKHLFVENLVNFHKIIWPFISHFITRFSSGQFNSPKFVIWSEILADIFHFLQLFLKFQVNAVMYLFFLV